jgi:excisionase family DNA binding protein
MPDDMLTVAEVAALLKLNPQTIRNWINQGTLPASHVGRSVRIRRRDLDSLIESGMISSRTAQGSTAAPDQWDQLASTLENASRLARRRDEAGLKQALLAVAGAARALSDQLDGHRADTDRPDS